MAPSKHERDPERAGERRVEQRSDAQRARARVLAVVVVLVAGAAAFGATLAMRGDDAAPIVQDTDLADATSAADEPVEPAGPSYADPQRAGAEPCAGPVGAPSPSVDEPLPVPPRPDLGSASTLVATLHTSCGDVVVELDAAGTPRTVANFVGLAESGYYVGVPFHRVIDGFMVQGGDPTGTGMGCLDDACEQRLPGYTFYDELATAEQLVATEGGYPRGTLAMANGGADTNGSQFFIVQGDPGYPLPPAYTVFGRVLDGLEVVDRIAAGPADGERAVTPTVILDVDVDGR